MRNSYPWDPIPSPSVPWGYSDSDDDTGEQRKAASPRVTAPPSAWGRSKPPLPPATNHQRKQSSSGDGVRTSKSNRCTLHHGAGKSGRTHGERQDARPTPRTGKPAQSSSAQKPPTRRDAARTWPRSQNNTKDHHKSGRSGGSKSRRRKKKCEKSTDTTRKHK